MIEQPVHDFESWRNAARRLLACSVPPGEIYWRDARDQQRSLPLLAVAATTELAASATGTEEPAAVGVHDRATSFHVPRTLVDLARHVACHRDTGRWSDLYSVLWRITHGERDLLEIDVDENVYALRRMQQAVRRDLHKMHAFVRFEKRSIDGRDEYLAFYRPDYQIFTLATPFFVERFGQMRWTIFGPYETVAYDGRQVTFLPGVERAANNIATDELAELWRSYYAATFNPARLNVRQMRREMPQRFWPLLPEVADMERLVASAPARTEKLIRGRASDRTAALTAKDFMPAENDLKTLAAAASVCQGCPLYADATQTIFGEGPPDARIVFVGEQPGDQEDVAGHPFVGPAGEVFDELLAEVGIDRSQAYVTNTVKHFKWEPRGKRRLHAKPNAREIHACRPWLEAELVAVRPEVIVLLGATAAQTIFGPQFRIQRERGQPRKSVWASWTIATYHPSAILRAGKAAHGAHLRQALRADLLLAAQRLRR